MSQTFTVGQFRYIAASDASVPFSVLHSLKKEFSFAEGVPVTLLALENDQLEDSELIHATIEDLLATDDVLSPEFTKTIFLQGLEGPGKETNGLHRLCEKRSCQFFAIETQKPLPSGPYFAVGSQLQPVYKLQEDPYKAFMVGILPSEGQQHTFREVSQEHIPVPSRLYFKKPSTAKPLNGMRVAVKDVYHLKGVPTSASCRDFRKFYGDAVATAQMVQRLIDAGAVIVGKTKTAQFASGEHAPDWVDYFCPFNPRGDGYMEPDGSSTGSASAMAGYEWLDFAIGTDTLGSMICPAGAQGLFAIRPTHGISDLQDIVPVSKLLDTAGVYARSIEALHHFAQTWYGQSVVPYDSWIPKTLLYAIEEFQAYPADKQAIIEAFVKDFEKHTQITRTEFNLTETWDLKAPKDYTRPIQEFLKTTLAHIQLYGSYNNNLKFRKDFQKTHGREPYANPMVRFKWNLGQELTDSDFKKACDEREAYRDFVRQHIFDENTVMILPAGSGTPRYRDVYDPPPAESGYALQGFSFLRELYCFIGGLPEIIIPVGQVKRTSPVTGAVVFEPVTIGLISFPSMDVELLRVAEQVLKASNRPLQVQVGADAFHN